MGSEYISSIKNQCMLLGIRKGTILFIHSSIKAIGCNVKAEELILALRKIIGEEGTLLFPTFYFGFKEYVFNPDETPSTMGTITEIFRKMPLTLRSRNPYHPVAAQGPMASRLIEGHEHAIGPSGAGTPFEKHAQMNGQILMIGVDLDTLTLLHTSEALLDLPYLNSISRKYLDAKGYVQTIKMRQVPVGHRGGVFNIEKILNSKGLIKYGRIGNARTMLMDAKPLLDALIKIMKDNPFAALCQNDYCPDCVNFKAKIRGKKLSSLGAGLSIVLPEKPKNHDAFKEMLERFCKFPVSFCLIEDLNIIKANFGEIPSPPKRKTNWVLQPKPRDLIKYNQPPKGYVGFAYSPLEAALEGLQPFYDVIYKSRCRDYITDIFIEEGLANLPGFNSPALGYLHYLEPDNYIILGNGHAQLKEIISSLRMRNFSGRYHIIVPKGNPYNKTLKLLKEFYNIAIF